jgi:PAS domain S-box-containing protein
MNDGEKTKEQLLQELDRYRLRVDHLEKADLKHKLMEDILRQSEERYRTILENIEDGYNEVDLKGRFTFFNESFRKIMGYTKDILLGMHYKQYSDAENAQKVYQAYNQVLRTGHPLKRFIWEIIRNDGARRQVAVSVSLIKDHSGKPIGFRGIVRDETDRQEAEEALISSEKKYREIFDNAAEGIYRASLEGKFLSVNPSLARMMGFDSPDEMIASISDIGQQSYVNSGQRTALLELLRTKDEVEGFEFEAYRKDQSTFWISTNVRVVRDEKGRILYLQGMCLDITKSKKAEEALKRERTKFQVLVEKSPWGIALINREGIYQFINSNFTEILGYTLDDFSTGQEWFQKAFPDPLYRNQVMAVWINDLKKIGIGESRPRSFKVCCKNGQEKWILFRPVSLEDGNQLLSYEDITEGTQTEEALRLSEERYRTIFEKSNDGIALMKGEVHLQVNQKMADIFGYHRPEEIIGQPISLTVHPDDLERVREINRRRQKEEGVPQKYEFMGCRKDGQTIFLEVSAATTEYQSQTVALIFLRDITERRLAEEALKKSEERYRTILESIEEGYYEVDITGNLTFFNDSICDLLGYPREELIGMNNRHYTDALNAKILYTAFSQVYRTGIPLKGVEWQVLRKDGTSKICDISVSPIQGEQGAIIGFRGIVRDTTERKRTEDALRESEERYRLLAENITIGIFRSTLSGQFLYANPAIVKIGGYDNLDDYLATPAIQMYADPGDRQRAISGLQLHGAVKDLEMRSLKKDGTVYWIAMNAILLRDKAGKAESILGFVRDITEEKKAEEEHRRLEERLQRAEKMEALGTLAGGVAHDLNNVLGVLVGYSELLMLDAPEDSSLREHASNIFQAGQRATAIIQDLLTLARRGVAISEILNLNQIIRDFLATPEFERMQYHHSQVTFREELASELFNIKGSPTHLIKTVMNLLANGAEAVSGQGEVVISTENRYIDKPIPGYEETREGEYVLLKVADSGMGIPPSDLRRIFEPFYTKKVMGRSGTGLGLAVVWGTVKDHSGYIDVQSEEGKGSTFTLYFPITREDLPEAQGASSRSEYLGRGESILIVDDVKEQRTLAAKILTGLGYRVETFSSGEEAVAYLQRTPMDLVLLDMIMEPGIDGLETYERILKIHPGQKAIIVSGFSETDRVRRAMALGAGAYIRKPYVLEKIGLAVRRELDK